jgi:hypothetical protein
MVLVNYADAIGAAEGILGRLRVGRKVEPPCLIPINDPEAVGVPAGRKIEGGLPRVAVRFLERDARQGPVG